MRFDITEDAVLYMHPELVLFILFVKPGGGPGYIVCSPQVVTRSVEMPLRDAQFMFLFFMSQHESQGKKVWKETENLLCAAAKQV